MLILVLYANVEHHVKNIRPCGINYEQYSVK
jgi:hypothetical protein